MPKVFLTCGKICSGKSTYANKLRTENNAVLLSVDEITLALFGCDAGENHDTYVERAENYLYEKSVEIIETGMNVVLDWGFWTKAERDAAKEFYRSRGIECEFHYIDIDDETWRKNLEKRNAEIRSGKVNAYYVDEGLAKKFGEIFEKPDKSEMDIWYINDWK